MTFKHQYFLWPQSPLCVLRDSLCDLTSHVSDPQGFDLMSCFKLFCLPGRSLLLVSAVLVSAATIHFPPPHSPQLSFSGCFILKLTPGMPSRPGALSLVYEEQNTEKAIASRLNLNLRILLLKPVCILRVALRLNFDT
ncbi:uncharacterized [Tachysurus ichikawai]